VTAIRHLTVDEVQAIQERLVARYGGDAVVRDAGLLESAVHRPRMGHYPDLAAMAAALIESLVLCRPYPRGNLRLAVFAADVLVRLNGARLALDAQLATEHLQTLYAQDEFDLAHLDAWLRPALVPTAGRPPDPASAGAMRDAGLP
jgi:death on curing protein